MILAQLCDLPGVMGVFFVIALSVFVAVVSLIVYLYDVFFSIKPRPRRARTVCLISLAVAAGCFFLIFFVFTVEARSLPAGIAFLAVATVSLCVYLRAVVQKLKPRPKKALIVFGVALVMAALCFLEIAADG